MGDLRQAGVSLAVPGKAIGQYGHPLHPTIPFAGQHGARSYVSSQAVQLHRPLARILGWSRSIKEPLAAGVQIAETIGLKPVRQNPQAPPV